MEDRLRLATVAGLLAVVPPLTCAGSQPHKVSEVECLKVWQAQAWQGPRQRCIPDPLPSVAVQAALSDAAEPVLAYHVRPALERKTAQRPIKIDRKRMRTLGV